MGFEFRVRQTEFDLDDDFWNIRTFPHTPYPVLLLEDGQMIAKAMNYSLIPTWSKDRRPKFASYNARVESIDEKPTWREPLQKHHCIVPITSFFESCYEGSHAGNIVQFKATEDSTLYAAGIYSEWLDKATGEIVDSFAIITKDPSEFIKGVGHDRSPLFLNHDDADRWLKQKPISPAEAKQFLLEHFVDPQLLVEKERPLKPGWEKRA